MVVPKHKNINSQRTLSRYAGWGRGWSPCVICKVTKSWRIISMIQKLKHSLNFTLYCCRFEISEGTTISLSFFVQQEQLLFYLTHPLQIYWFWMQSYIILLDYEKSVGTFSFASCTYGYKEESLLGTWKVWVMAGCVCDRPGCRWSGERVRLATVCRWGRSGCQKNDDLKGWAQWFPMWRRLFVLE